MIKSSAPTRISLMGGGTDVAPYCDLYGGFCLSMAINIRQEIVFDDFLFKSTIPINANWKFYDKFFEVLNYRPRRFRAEFDGEITGGIGSSASAAVALVGAIAKAKDTKYELDEIARIAWDIEVNKIKMFGGRQDQWAAAYGGVNLFQFEKDCVKTTPLTKDFIKPLLPYLMLFHTGKNRKSGKIQEGLKELRTDQIKYLNSIKGLVFEALKVIPAGKINAFADLLNLSWEYKKMSNKGVSNNDVDKLFIKAKKCGAMALKLNGSGGGGYALFLVNPDDQKSFIKNIGLKHIDFSVDWQGLSARKID